MLDASKNVYALLALIENLYSVLQRSIAGNGNFKTQHKCTFCCKCDYCSK